MWTIGTCPTTVLLSTMSECVYVWQLWRRLLLGILHKMWCVPVCSPGSWSGRGWLPLILAWRSKVIGLGCIFIVKRSRKYLVFMDRYIKLLHLRILQIYNLFTTSATSINLADFASISILCSRVQSGIMFFNPRVCFQIRQTYVGPTWSKSVSQVL